MTFNVSLPVLEQYSNFTFKAKEILVNVKNYFLISNLQIKEKKKKKKRKKGVAGKTTNFPVTLY